MYKFKLTNFLIIFIVIVICFFIVLDYFLGTNLQKLKLESNQYSEIVAKRQISKESLIDKLYFNNHDLLYDKQDNMWYYSIVKGEKDSLNPKVKFKGRDKDLKISFLLPQEINNDFIRTNKDIIVFSYTKDKYFASKVKITTLPVINITHNYPNKIEKTTTVDCQMTLFDNYKGTKQRNISSKCEIHARGDYTSTLAKTSFKLSLKTYSVGEHKRNNHISLLGMRKDDDWILYSPYVESEKVRNVFAMNLWNESCAQNNDFNIKLGNEYKFVELFLNGTYYGLYALTSPIDEKQARLKKDINGNFNEFMFKKVWWDKSEFNISNIPSVMLGYKLISKNNKELDIPEPKDYREIMDQEYRYFQYNKGAWEVINLYYKNLLNTKDKDLVYKIADIKNSVDIFLFINFLQCTDSVDAFNYKPHSIKHFFFTFKKYKNIYKALYNPWDLEAILGASVMIDNNFPRNGQYHYLNRPNKNFIMKISPVGHLLELNDNKIKMLIKNRYRVLRKSYWSKSHLLKLIKGYEKDIYLSGAYIREQNRWPQGTYQESNKKLKRFRNYVLKRLYYMDLYVKQL